MGVKSDRTIFFDRLFMHQSCRKVYLPGHCLVLSDVIFQGNVDFHEFKDKRIILEISADPQQI